MGGKLLSTSGTGEKDALIAQASEYGLGSTTYQPLIHYSFSSGTTRKMVHWGLLM